MKTFKNLSFLASIIAVSFIITGCPLSTSYPLGDRSSALPFERAMIGNWHNSDTTGEAELVRIERSSSPNIYRITVVEEGQAFAADSHTYEGWLTWLEGKTFLVLQVLSAKGLTNEFYVYHLEIGNNQLITHDISLLVKGTDAITSISAYREEAVASMKQANFLGGKTIYRKK